MVEQKYKIYIETYDGKQKYQLPVLPAKLPEVSYSADAEDFQSTSGHYTIIGDIQRPEIDAEALLPKEGKDLSFVVSNTTGAQIVSMIRTEMTARRPIRYIITKTGGGNLVNGLYAVTEFSWQIDKKEDYVITFALKGWKSYKNWNSGKAYNGITTKTLPKGKAAKKVIALSVKALKLKRKQSKKLRLKNATGKVTWKSSKKKIATVSKKGVVKGKKKGKCKIYAIHKKKKYTCKVTVR